MCVAALVVCAPIMVLIAISIRVDSPGSHLFVQTRLGRHRQPFKCYKFRSMHLNTGDQPTHMVAVSAITRVGRFIRATKLDELPQLWNVLKGEMSLVGPRPCLPSQSELIIERQKQHVFDCLPGVTGLAQIRGLDMSRPSDVAKTDAEYKRSASLALDLRIMMGTLLGARIVGLTATETTLKV